MGLHVNRCAKEFVGSCIEGEAQGSRLVLDVGLSLGGPDDGGAREWRLPKIPGFSARDDSLRGILNSHRHLARARLWLVKSVQSSLSGSERMRTMFRRGELCAPNGDTFANSRFIALWKPVERGMPG